MRLFGTLKMMQSAWTKLDGIELRSPAYSSIRCNGQMQFVANCCCGLRSGVIKVILKYAGPAISA